MATHKDQAKESLQLTEHAFRRSNQRKISLQALEMTLEYGHIIYTNHGTQITRIGKKEISHLKNLGIQVPSNIEGTQIISNPKNGRVITVYRNRDFSKTRKHLWN